MNITINDKLKIQILKQYEDKNIDYTASYLAKILNAKYETINKGLEFFYKINILNKDIKEHGEKTITYYSLTKIGEQVIRSL